MRRPSTLFVVFTIAAASCRSGAPLLPADAIVEGRTAQPVAVDTVEGSVTVSVDPGRWKARQRASDALDFWDRIAILDVPGAERAARSVDERTFAVALKMLMASDPEGAAIAFRVLHFNATDANVRARSRIGLTMALSWQSDWPALAGIGAAPDSAVHPDSLEAQSGVERWGRALSGVPAPLIEIPDAPVVLPLRRSAFGTPIVTVRINGHEHEFWLDTGASMTVLSAEAAVQSGALLAARDTLALSVIAGHIPARAAYIDSLSIGKVVARGLGAALVNRGALRLDLRTVNGVRESVDIDGVIGTDLLRLLDVTIDAQANTITLQRPKRDPGAVPNLFWIGYPVVRLITADGTPALFGLDTGAEVTFVTAGFLHKQPRTPVAMRRGTISGLGGQEQPTAWVARQIALSDGDHAISLSNVPVAPDKMWTFVRFDGVLGADVALASRLHLDFLNGVFDVRRSAAGPIEKTKVPDGR
ncbi:MAG TPA: aspartyl protease family protein [Gemmatimonadaceae bacterium]